MSEDMPTSKIKKLEIFVNKNNKPIAVKFFPTTVFTYQFTANYRINHNSYNLQDFFFIGWG